MLSTETTLGVSPAFNIQREKNPAHAVVRDLRGRREAESSIMAPCNSTLRVPASARLALQAALTGARSAA